MHDVRSLNRADRPECAVAEQHGLAMREGVILIGRQVSWPHLGRAFEAKASAADGNASGPEDM
jgi:hypothetical protein